jgi:SagB-type dehydrogenase family enzyme
MPARTVPSAGALYPVEVYLVVNDVVGLEPGVYHYAVRAHTLELILQERVGEKLVEATLGQTMCGACPVVFAWTAVVERCRCRYGQRAYRYIYLDAGHAAQNLALTAAALGLGSCQIGALYDEEVEKILGVNGDEEPVLYLSTVGYPR